MTPEQAETLSNEIAAVLQKRVEHLSTHDKVGIWLMSLCEAMATLPEPMSIPTLESAVNSLRGIEVACRRLVACYADSTDEGFE